jgi:hypothetical protein
VAKGARYPVNVQLLEKITLTNNSTTDKNFAFYVPHDENRFKLVLIPGYGVIKPGESTQIEVKFTLLMTTSISRKIKFEVLGKRKGKKSKEKRKKEGRKKKKGTYVPPHGENRFMLGMIKPNEARE